MNFDRRSFLKGVLTVAAAAVSEPVTALVPTYPILWGDLIHDDAPALNAMLSGKPVMCENKLITWDGFSPISLIKGNYLIGSTIYVVKNTLLIYNCIFKKSKNFKGEHVMHISGDVRHIYIDQMYVPENKS